MKFPHDFNWGVATSSYQIEGAADVDGRGKSVWDTFCEIPGKVVNGENGDVACDHYNRYPEDVAIMKELGVTSYRFSISWPRLFPNGDSVREERGFDFYNRLINELIAHGIEPVITLYHWDLPQALEDKGGWANRDIVTEFAHYAAACVSAFGDRVTNWITLNEPWCFTWLGYLSGIHAPGRQDLDSAIATAHHSALAHAQATRAMKAIKSDINVGIALNMTTFRVTDQSVAELKELETLMDGQMNRWWLDAMYSGTYPAEVVASFGDRLAKVVEPGDMDLVKIAPEFVGVNYYADSFINPAIADSAADEPASSPSPFPFDIKSDGTPPLPHTDMGWPITPQGLYDLLLRLNRDWPLISNIAITENGAAYPEGPNSTGEIDDERRVRYLEAHIDSVSRAIADGATVKSYFAWSLMDNFEWAEGYAKRFGIVHVDFETLERTLKNSAKFYQGVIKEHSNSLDLSLVQSR